MSTIAPQPRRARGPARVLALWAERAFGDPAQAAALLAAMRDTVAAAHLDTDSVAALLDGGFDAQALAHALRCSECERAVEIAAAAFDIDDLAPGSGGPDGGRIDLRVPPPALFATLALSHRGIDLCEYSGVARVAAAVPTRRGGASVATVTLRDRATAPNIELGIFCDRLALSAPTITLVARMCDGTAPGASARAYQRGRLVAETPLQAGAAVLSELRAADTRLEVTAADRVHALAWIRFDAATAALAH